MTKKALLEYLNKANKPASISEIMRDLAAGKSDQEHQQISRMLQTLKREGQVFRSVKQGHAYYSTDASQGEGTTGTQNFIDQLSSFFSPQGADSVQEESELPATSPVYWSFQQNLRMDLEELSLPIPDGFAIVPDKERGCIAVEKGYEHNREDAPIQILPGQLLNTGFQDDEDLDLVKLFATFHMYETMLNMSQSNAFFRQEARVKEFAYGAIGAMQALNAFSYLVLFVARNGLRVLRIQTHDTPLAEYEKEMDAIIAWFNRAKPKKLPESIRLDRPEYARNPQKLLQAVEKIKKNLSSCAGAYANIGIMEKRLTGEEFEPGEGETIIKRQFSKAQRLIKTRVFEIDAALKAVANPPKDLSKKAYDIINALFPLKIPLDGQQVSIPVDSEIQACLKRWKDGEAGEASAQEESEKAARAAQQAAEKRRQQQEEQKRAEEERKRKAEEARRREEAERQKKLEDERNRAAREAALAIKAQKEQEEAKKRAEEERKRKAEEARRAEEERKKKQEEERRQAAAKALWEAEEKRKAEDQQRKKKRKNWILFILVLVLAFGGYHVFMQYRIHENTIGYLTNQYKLTGKYSFDTDEYEFFQKHFAKMSSRNLIHCLQNVSVSRVDPERLDSLTTRMNRNFGKNEELRSELRNLQLAVIRNEKLNGDYSSLLPVLVDWVLKDEKAVGYYTLPREGGQITQADVDTISRKFGTMSVGERVDFYDLLDAFHNNQDRIRVTGFDKIGWPDDVSILFERGVEFPVNQILTSFTENLVQADLSDICEILNRYAAYNWKQYDENGSLEKILAYALETSDIYITKQGAGGHYDQEQNSSSRSNKAYTPEGIEYTMNRSSSMTYYGDFSISNHSSIAPRTGNDLDYMLVEYDEYRFTVHRKGKVIYKSESSSGSKMASALRSAMDASEYCLMQGEEDTECILISDTRIAVPDGYVLDMGSQNYLYISGDYSDLIHTYIEPDAPAQPAAEAAAAEEVIADEAGESEIVIPAEEATDAAEAESAQESAEPEAAEEETVYVYATTNGRYYHLDANCPGMRGAKRYALEEMAGKKHGACPVCKAPHHSLEVFRDRDTVKQVQQKLNELGYDCGTPDGIAGKRTIAGISQYQTEKGLNVTGTATYELLLSLGLDAE